MDSTTSHPKSLSKNNCFRSAEAKTRRNKLRKERRKRSKCLQSKQDVVELIELKKKNMQLEQENRILKHCKVDRFKQSRVTSKYSHFPSSVFNEIRNKYVSVAVELKRKVPTFSLKHLTIYTTEIGEGVFGKVLSANIDSMSQRVAIKTFSSNYSDMNIFAEAYVYAEMSGHPNFPYFYGLTDDNRRIILEHILCAETLQSALTGTSTVKFWKAICLQLISAFHQLHVKNVLHNDIHSGNILLKYGKHVKVIDFGKSTLITDPVVYNVKPGTEKHRRYERYHRHLAYELRNIPGSKVTIKSDIYSMGYIFRKIAKKNSSLELQSLAADMMNTDATKRPTLPEVFAYVKKM